MSQLLLIPDPRPLDERLGEDFFRNAPKRPGVYVMRDAADKVLYVGKAKNLQQRLRNYRIANPDRMPRRHLKLVRQVVKIDFELCPTEASALKHESKLLRALKPKFNRAGVWSGKTQFITWRIKEDKLQLAVMEVPEAGWQRFGPVGGMAAPLTASLCRLLWLASNPSRSVAEFPINWTAGHCDRSISAHPVNDVVAGLDSFFWGEPNQFLVWLAETLTARTHPFERVVIEAELESLTDFATKRERWNRHSNQLALL